MRKLKKIRNYPFRALGMTVLFALLSLITWAQTPTHIPWQNPEPVGFFESTENIFFFVVVPVLILIFYLLWRRNLRKQREKDEQ